MRAQFDAKIREKRSETLEKRCCWTDVVDVHHL